MSNRTIATYAALTILSITGIAQTPAKKPVPAAKAQAQPTAKGTVPVAGEPEWQPVNTCRKVPAGWAFTGHDGVTKVSIVSCAAAIKEWAYTPPVQHE